MSTTIDFSSLIIYENTQLTSIAVRLTTRGHPLRSQGSGPQAESTWGRGAGFSTTSREHPPSCGPAAPPALGPKKGRDLGILTCSQASS